nr:hypothetical protein JVH1_4059 [Rhodococcus sp. JVH1]
MTGVTFRLVELVPRMQRIRVGTHRRQSDFPDSGGAVSIAFRSPTTRSSACQSAGHR